MDNRPGILVITARADFGGGPEHIFRLIKELHTEINFYAACPADYPYWDRYKAILGDNNLFKIPHRKFSIRSLSKMVSFCRKKKIKIVHSHGKGAGIYGRLVSLLTMIPCIHTFHGIHMGNYSPLQKIAYLFTERFLSLYTKQFISVSETESEIVIKKRIAPAGKIIVIPNGTYLPASKINFDFSNDIFGIATITRFDFAKNTGLLIPVAEELLKKHPLKKFVFTVIGSGPEETDFIKKVSEKNLTGLFHFTGFTPDPSEFLMNSFCYISTSKWEGLPLGVLEAMGWGLPVIATNVSGNRDLVFHGENGYLYNINNPVEAAAYISALVSDQKNYQKLSENARGLIKNNYTVEKMAGETLKVYKRFI